MVTSALVPDAAGARSEAERSSRQPADQPLGASIIGSAQWTSIQPIAGYG